MIAPPPSSTLFPYTTLFRSNDNFGVGFKPDASGWVRLAGIRAGYPIEIEARADSREDRKSTRLNSSHLGISYAVFCLKKKKARVRQQSNAVNRANPRQLHRH